MNIRSFGKLPKGERLERIRKSPQYRDGRFRNIESTSINPEQVSFFKILTLFLSRPSSVHPAKPMPSEFTDLRRLDSKEPVMVWFGHSSYFIQVMGFTILVDPVFGGNASPFPFFGKAFKGADIYKPDDLPQLDLLVLTHDHYDHLDPRSIRNLIDKTGQVICPLGVGAHLEYWGIDQQKITELDWWEDRQINKNVKVKATPARHFSGRGFKRNQTLWCSYVLEIHGQRYFLGGDSGYDTSFRKIGKDHGPFDVAFLECGQYGKYWPQIHMFPEQTLQAGKDLEANTIFPVHHGKFALSTHPWNEPVKKFAEAADKENYPFIAPRIGRAIFPGGEFLRERWWEL